MNTEENCQTLKVKTLIGRIYELTSHGEIYLCLYDTCNRVAIPCNAMHLKHQC